MSAASPRARPGRALAIWTGLLVTVGLLGFHRGHFTSSDEVGVYETTRSLAERLALDVPPIPMAFPGRDGQLYSQYAVGQSLLAVPLYELGRLAEATLPWRWKRALQGPARQMMGRPYRGGVPMFFVGLYAPLAIGLLVAVFVRFQEELGATPASSVLAGLTLGFASHAAILGTVFLRHGTEALLALTALLAFTRYRHDPRDRLLLGGVAAAAAIPLLRLPGGSVLPVILGYGALCAWPHLRSREAGSWLRTGTLAAAPLVGAVLLWAALEHWKWGSLWNTPMLGERDRFAQSLLESLWGFLLSPGASIFVYSVPLLLAPWATRTLAATRPVLAATGWVILAVTLLFYGGYTGWTGLWSCPGPRYLFVAVPVLWLGLGPWLDGGRGAGRRRALLVTATLGFVVELAFLTTSWHGLVQQMGWQDFEPKWGFLFIPDESPPAAALAAFARGAWHGPWLDRLARGWPGFEGQPRAAWALAGLWLVAVALTAYGLLRALRRARDERETGAPGAAG